MIRIIEAIKAKLVPLGKAMVCSIQDFVKDPQKKSEQIVLGDGGLIDGPASTNNISHLFSDATNYHKEAFLNELQHILPEYERIIASCLEPELNGACVKCKNNGCDHYNTYIVRENRTVKFAEFRTECDMINNRIILTRIAVHNSLRRRNIGRTIISAIEEAAKRFGCKYLEVTPSGYPFHGKSEDDAFLFDLYGKHPENSEITQQNRVSFYKSCGFTVLETKEHDICRMRKLIN